MGLVVRVNAETIFRAGRPVKGAVETLRNLSAKGFQLELTGRGDLDHVETKCLEHDVTFDSRWEPEDGLGVGGRWAYWIVFGKYTNFQNWADVWEYLQEVSPDEEILE